MTSQPVRPDIKDFSHARLVDYLEQHGIRSFRASQILKWVYIRQADGFGEMTDLKKDVRTSLDEAFTIKRLKIKAVESSKDGTKKYLFELEDQQRIESVLIPERDHHTLCISTQVGCAQGCGFCRTAQLGFIRNLTPGEIIGQVRDVVRETGGDKPLTNIVFMGMGEPLANYRNLIRALDVITNNDWGLRFAGRKVTVSTAGLINRIPDLGKDSRVNLAVSLNAADNPTRTRLMPINRKFPIEELIAACRRFPLPKGRRITFEYILMDGVNDTEADARRLAKLLRPVKAKINLIPFNAHEGSEFKAPSASRVEAFRQVLIDSYYTVIIRHSKGQDISAACGQLHAKAADGGSD